MIFCLFVAIYFALASYFHAWSLSGKRSCVLCIVDKTRRSWLFLLCIVILVIELWDACKNKRRAQFVSRARVTKKITQNDGMRWPFRAASQKKQQWRRLSFGFRCCCDSSREMELFVRNKHRHIHTYSIRCSANGSSQSALRQRQAETCTICVNSNRLHMRIMNRMRDNLGPNDIQHTIERQ